MQAGEYISLGNTKYENEDYQGAIAYFNTALQLDPSSFLAYLGKGVAYQRLGNSQAAEDALNAAILLSPDDRGKASAYAILGATKLALKKDSQGAIACFNIALQLNPSLRDMLIAEEYANLGLTMLDNEDYQGAIAYYDVVLYLDPSSFIAHFSKGVTYQKLGDSQAAETALNAAIRFCPNDPSKAFTYARLGDTKLALKKDYQGAIACYDAALQLNPSLGDVHLSKGLAYYQLGDNKAAEVALSAAIQLCPENGLFSNHVSVAAAYALRCTSRLGLDNRTGAWKDYQIVFSLDKRLANDIRIYSQTCVGASQQFIFFALWPAQIVMITQLLVSAK